MEPIEIIRLGRDMRKAQKEYFRIRTTANLKKAKHLEKCFDDAVQQFLNPSTQLCFNDFNTLPAPWLDISLEPLK
jgi:hypothetical protein